jgi:hypothetical protein
MRKLVPFELDPMLRANHNPEAPCADCGKVIELRHARIVMVDISETRRGRGAKEISLDEMARNIVWTILCQECWQQQYHIDPGPERIQ